MQLSISAIKLFKACRRAYELRYVYKVTPIQTSEALETGLNYHKMIEDFETTGKLPELTSKEAAMAMAYAKYIHKDMPMFVPEQWFECKIGRGKQLIGRLDGVSVDNKAVIEHKTTSVNSIDEYEYDLQLDEQLMAYLMATGFNTVYYTVCRKPMLRQKQNETAEEFSLRCFEWFSDDTYDKIRLIKVFRTDEEIEAFRDELRMIFKQVSDAEKHGLFYRNTCHCKAWGRKCEYASICLHYDPEEEYIGFEKG